MEKVFDTQIELLLSVVEIEQDDCLPSYLKVYSNLDSLESCKVYEDETPLFIEIARVDDYINDGEGFGLTIDQAKELINVLQNSIEYLETK
jgi:hypothetical protein